MLRNCQHDLKAVRVLQYLFALRSLVFSSIKRTQIIVRKDEYTQSAARILSHWRVPYQASGRGKGGIGSFANTDMALPNVLSLV